MADTTGKILFWLIGTVTCNPVIGLIGLLISGAHFVLGSSL